MNFQLGLITKKIGMTQIFEKDGRRVPVTVLRAVGNQVLAHRTVERDGYSALVVAFDEKKPSRCTKAELGRFQQANISPKYIVREFRVAASVLEQYAVGAEVPLSLFEAGASIDVTGTTKGKGFQGVMKRHNMRGEQRTHGNHESFRHGGSIGCRKTPGRVLPGKKMAGHMGNERLTQQNMTVARVLPEQGVLLVRGPVPGSKNSYITVRHAIKKAIREGNNKG